MWALGGCEKAPEPAQTLTQKQEPTEKAEAKAVPQEPLEHEAIDTSAIIARVNGIPIYTHALESQLIMAEAGESVFRDMALESKDDQESGALTLKMNVLNGMIALELAAKEAIDRGYAPTEAELVAEIKKAIEEANADSEGQPAPSPDELSQYEKELRKQLPKTLALKKWHKYEFLPQMAVPIEEAWATYIQNPHLSLHGDIIRARQIFIGVPLLASPEARKNAQDKAELTLKRLKNGEAFGAVARQMSNDPDVNETGGDLGWMTKESYLPFLGQALQTMKPGELSEVIAAPTGFYIYQMVGAKDAGLEPFEGIRAHLVEYLSNKKLSRAVLIKTTQLYNQAEIEIYDPILKQAFDKSQMNKSPSENLTTEAKE